MTIILTCKDLDRPIVDIRADKAKPIDCVKPALRPAIKSSSNVWLLDQGRFTCLKGAVAVPIILGAGQTSLANKLTGE